MGLNVVGERAKTGRKGTKRKEEMEGQGQGQGQGQQQGSNIG